MATPASVENTAAPGARGALAMADSVARKNCLSTGANQPLQMLAEHAPAYAETVLITLILAPLSLKLAGRLATLESASVSAI